MTSRLLKEPAGVIDKAKLLERVWHDKTVLKKAIGMFLDSCPGMLAAVRQAIAQRDHAMLQSELHKLKGVLGSLAAMAAYRRAAILEEQALACAAWPEIEQACAHLTSAVECALPQLERFAREYAVSGE